VSIGLLLVPAAATAGVRTLANPEKGMAKLLWTPERLQAAQALEVQEVAFAEGAEELDARLDLEAGPQGAEGYAGRGGAGDLARRLFAPAEGSALDREDAAAVALGEPAVGSTGAYFTSQPLVPVTADLTYPYRTVGLLFFHIPGKGDFFCSAAVVRKRLIVTAGQCVHAGKANPGFYEDFLFVPAYRDGVAPYGIWEWEYVVVNTAWSQGGGGLPNAADYALIELQDELVGGVLRKVGDIVGFLGYIVKKLRPNHATILAYTSVFDGAEKMHQVAAKDFRAAAANNVEYGSDMRAGSAGGPLIQDFGGSAAKVKWIGCLSYFTSATGPKVQGASIPDNRFTSLLTQACNHRAGNC
jgi:V8-like Glu-specific endopeptidase